VVAHAGGAANVAPHAADRSAAPRARRRPSWQSAARQTSRAEFDGAAQLTSVPLALSDRAEGVPHPFLSRGARLHHRDKSGAHVLLAAAKGIRTPTRRREPLKTLRHDSLYNALAASSRVGCRSSSAQEQGWQPKKRRAPTRRSQRRSISMAALSERSGGCRAPLPSGQALLTIMALRSIAVKIWGALVEKFPSSPYRRTRAS